MRTRPALLLLSCVALQAHAADPALPPAPASAASAPTVVEVKGRRNATEERRLSSAAKIIVDREEIEQYGDLSLGEVLRRLPSVTTGGRPGRGGGQVRMRGMGGGYTQILVDGERMAPGFSIDQIPPEQVERIEIYRAPTAEIGARAVAGTINIVLREPLRLNNDELRLGVSHDRRGLRPNASWARNGLLGERGTYTLNLSASGSELRSHNESSAETTDAATGTLLRTQQRQGDSVDRREQATLGGRVQWQLGDSGSGQNVSLQPFLSLNQGRGRNASTLQQSDGLQSHDRAQSQSGQHSASGRLMANGRHRLGEGPRIEWRATLGALASSSHSELAQFLNSQPAPVLQQTSRTEVRDRSWSLGLKASQLVAEQHSLVAGLEAEGVRRQEDGLQRAETLASGVSGVPVAVDADSDLRARTQRLAAYLQNEWNPAPRWAANAGVRWEEIHTTSDAAASPVSNTGRVVTPMGHLVWRFGGEEARRSRDQLRLSLTRSYRPPSLGNLTGLPRFNTTDPVPGANSAITPDRAGNPALKPELARGLDLALEHYFGSSGVLSLSAFSRRIQGLIRNVTELETVPWATVPRWVNRPRNLGDARVEGVEVDGKARLSELWGDTTPEWEGLSLRGNLGLYRSRVGGIPGPNNRIDGQPRLSLNLGLDHRFRGSPWSAGGGLNAVPGYTVQQTLLQANSVTGTRVVDVYAVRSVGSTSKLRLSVGNLLPRSYRSATVLQSGTQWQTTRSGGPTYRVINLRWETRL